MLRKFIIAIFLLVYSMTAFADFTLEDLDALQPRLLRVKDGQLEYYRFGEGTPIILVAGYATGVSSWNKYLLIALAKEHQVIIFNNRGIGRSMMASENYYTLDLAQDVHLLIQGLGLKKVSLLGLSMGGMIAQQVAVSYPADLSHLILMNTAIAGPQGVAPSADIEQSILNMPQNLFLRYLLSVRLFAPPSAWPQVAVSILRDGFYSKWNTDVDFSEDTLKKQQQLIYAWSKDEVTAEQLKTVQIPTLVLNGTADIVIPPINSEILEKAIPHAKLMRLENGGHGMIYQYPNEIAATINQFIS